MARALDAAEPAFAVLVLDEDTDIVERSLVTPLRQFKLYQALYYGPDHQRSWQFAYAPNQPAFVLTAHPEAFRSVALADGLTIASAQDALDWACAYLETTRTNTEVFYLVASLEDVQVLTTDDLDVNNAIATFKTNFAGVITPPQAGSEDSEYRVTIWAIREQTLERHDLMVGRDGSITSSIAVIANNLPLVYSA